MVRTYAGILGSLAVGLTLADALWRRVGLEAATTRAWFALLICSVAGAVIGWLAQRTVDESVRSKFFAELSARESSATKPTA